MFFLDLILVNSYNKQITKFVHHNCKKLTMGGNVFLHVSHCAQSYITYKHVRFISQRELTDNWSSENKQCSFFSNYLT